MSFEPVLTLSDMPGEEPLEIIRFIGGTKNPVVEPKLEPKPAMYMHELNGMFRVAATANPDEVTKLSELAGTFAFQWLISSKVAEYCRAVIHTSSGIRAYYQFVIIRLVFCLCQHHTRGSIRSKMVMLIQVYMTTWKNERNTPSSSFILFLFWRFCYGYQLWYID